MCLPWILLWAVICHSPPTLADGDFDTKVDATTEFVVYPTRGLTFQRSGTILSHPQMNLLTAVITLDPLKYRQTRENIICREALWSVERRFNATMRKYKNITDAIFQSKNIFTTEEICDIFDYEDDHPKVCPNKNATSHRDKRFASIGAYSLAGAAMATALAAVGLATSNKVEIDKIKNFLEQQEEEISELQKQLRQTNDKLEVVTDVQNSMLGYIEEMSTRIDDLNTKVDCFNKHFLYLHWAQELQAEVENLLQFVFLGNINGKLTPTLIRPDLLRTFIEKQSVVNANILNRYPNVLYSSAMASLLKADFENLQFTYLITFPNFDSEAIYPYLTISQNGFWAKVPESNSTVCLMYKMPNTAVIHNNRLFALKNSLNCPDFGNVRICDRHQLDLIPMSTCLSLLNQTWETATHEFNTIAPCQLTKCVGYLQNDDVYISSSSGLLLRTLSPKIDIVYNKPKHQLDLYVSAMIKSLITPESRAIFIPWHANVSAVSFAKNIVYSPINANHHVQLTISSDEKIASLNLFSLLSIPSEATRQITALIEEQQKRLDELENEIEPSFSTMRDWASDTFSIPVWLRAIIFFAFALGVITLFKFVYKIISKQFGKFKDSKNDNAANYHQLQREPPLTTNPIYPQLPTPTTNPNIPYQTQTSGITVTVAPPLPANRINKPQMSAETTNIPVHITSIPETNNPPQYRIDQVVSNQ